MTISDEFLVRRERLVGDHPQPSAQDGVAGKPHVPDPWCLTYEVSTKVTGPGPDDEDDEDDDPVKHDEEEDDEVRPDVEEFPEPGEEPMEVCSVGSASHGGR